ncbi:MAG: hypothetical protein CW691_00855 [Candidatus Bathyarchaeum sp.]|nr:MAG: hypothetical protein CW691_00855 [Candidatus Bathyarchaeum sp.]
MKILLKDSRKSFTEIAKECGVSITTIKNRYSELEKAGIILGSTVIVNVKNLGYVGHLILYVNVKFDQVEQFLEYTNKIPGVMTYHVTLNKNHNAQVLLPVKNMNEMELRRKQIKKHPSVIDVKANVWTAIRSIPENFLPEHS